MAPNRGNGRSRAPTIFGIRYIATPSSTGMANRNIISVPCMVKSWLYSSGPTMSCSGRASWVRMSIASTPPTRKKNSPVTMNRSPTDVWLTAASCPQPGQLPQTRSYSRCRRAACCCSVAGLCSLIVAEPLLPRRKILGGMGVNGEFHVRVTHPAELRALAVVGAGLVRLQAQHVGAPRQHVELAPRPRHPDRVDHVGAGQVQVHRLASGNVQLVTQLYTLLGIPHLPPPLMPGNLDTQGLLADRQWQHAVTDGDTEGQQHAHAGDRQDQAPADDPAMLDTPGLPFIDLTRPAAQRVQPQRHYHHQYQHGKARHAPPECGSVGGGGASGTECRVG